MSLPVRSKLRANSFDAGRSFSDDRY